MSASEPPVPIDTLLTHRSWVRQLAVTLAADASAADDLEQRTWLRVLLSPPRHGAGLRTWFARVVRSQALNTARGATRRTAREEARARPNDGRTKGTRPTADVVAEAESHEHLVAAVMRLDEPYRTTVLLRFYEDLPPREVAERMSVPVETVRTRTRRALALLRERLGRGQGRGDSTWLGAIAPLLVLGRDGSIGASATTSPLLTGGVVMAGKKTVAAAVALGCAAGFAGGRLAAPSGDVATQEEVAALVARVDAMEDTQHGEAPRQGRSELTLDARLRALETRRAPGADLEAALLSILDDPSPELRERLGIEGTAGKSAATQPKASGKKKPWTAEEKAGLEWFAGVINREIDRWQKDYEISGSQVEQLKELGRRSLDEIASAKREGAPAQAIAAMEVAGQAETRRIVGDRVYEQIERDRITREARASVPILSAAVGLTPDQHEAMDRAIAEGVERNLADVVRVRSVPMPESERAALLERLATQTQTDWERYRDEILTEDQRRRIPGK